MQWRTAGVVGTTSGIFKMKGCVSHILEEPQCLPLLRQLKTVYTLLIHSLLSHVKSLTARQGANIMLPMKRVAYAIVTRAHTVIRWAGDQTIRYRDAEQRMKEVAAITHIIVHMGAMVMITQGGITAAAAIMVIEEMEDHSIAQLSLITAPIQKTIKAHGGSSSGVRRAE